MKQIRLFTSLIATVLLAAAGCTETPPEDTKPQSHITLSDYSASIDHLATEVSFSVLSDVAWTLSIEDEWITSQVMSAQAGTNTEVTLFVDDNYTGETRVGNVFITGTNTENSTAFVIKQITGTGPDPDHKFSIRASGIGGGRVIAEPAKAKAGTTVTITAIPDPGYLFFGWEEATGLLNIVPDRDNELVATFEMPFDNVSITANFGTKDYDPATDFTDQLTGVNQNIYGLMRDWYYWNDAVRTAVSVPNNNLPNAQFLEQLIEGLRWDKVQDVSHGESPATIDGQWDYSRTKRDHIYSYIQSNAPTRAGINESTFGLGFIPLATGFDPNFTDGSQIRYLLITWIVPGGPAEAAGLKRGTVISKYNGTDVRYQQYYNFFNQVYNGQGTSMTLTDVSGRQYALNRVSMNVSPIIVKKMLTSSTGKKVAYLAYSNFEDGGRNNTFNNELRSTFGEVFAGADELVLDFRYNGGGSVVACQVLSSLVGNVDGSKIFAKMLHNPHTVAVNNLDNPEVWPFFNEPNSLRLNKVYVLGTKSTASASEMVISAMMGVDIEVILIGEETNGKNVGMDGYTVSSGGSYYEFRPITFKILNGKDFCDYAGGFQPDYKINELRSLSTTDGSGIRELGDPEEDLLKAALAHIDGRRPEVDNTTRGGGGAESNWFTGKLEPPAQGLMGNSYELRGDKWERVTMR